MSSLTRQQVNGSIYKTHWETRSNRQTETEKTEHTRETVFNQYENNNRHIYPFIKIMRRRSERRKTDGEISGAGGKMQ